LKLKLTQLDLVQLILANETMLQCSIPHKCEINIIVTIVIVIVN